MSPRHVSDAVLSRVLERCSLQEDHVTDHHPSIHAATRCLPYQKIHLHTALLRIGPRCPPPLKCDAVPCVSYREFSPHSRALVAKTAHFHNRRSAATTALRHHHPRESINCCRSNREIARRASHHSALDFCRHIYKQTVAQNQCWCSRAL